MSHLLANPYVLAALKGAGAASLPVLTIDFQSFKNFQSPGDVKAYNWKVAGFKLLQAVVLGGAAGLGLGSI